MSASLERSINNQNGDQGVSFYGLCDYMHIGPPRLIREFLIKNNIQVNFVKPGVIPFEQADHIHLIVKGEPLDRDVLPLKRSRPVRA